MIGVNFQPGTDPRQSGRRRTPPQNVQEAIKVLSLRLPRVVGANAVAPAPLLQSRGAGGMPDSVVQSILQRMFPQAGRPAMPAAPVPPAAPPAAPPAPPMPAVPFSGGDQRVGIGETFAGPGGMLSPQVGIGDTFAGSGGMLSPNGPQPNSGLDGNDIPPGSIAQPPPPFPRVPEPPPYLPPEPEPELPRRAERRPPPVDEAPELWRRFPHITVGPNPTLPDMPSLNPLLPPPMEIPLTGGIPEWLRFGRFFGGGGGEDGEPPSMF